MAYATLTLIRTATGESWDDLMEALGRSNSENYSCKINASYQDYLDAGSKPISCGDFYSTYLFFGTYLIMITLFFLNLFIAIILNGYFETRDNDGHSISPEMVYSFK